MPRRTAPIATVWAVPVAAAGELGWRRGLAALSDADRLRVERFRDEADGRRLAVSRAALRALVEARRPGAGDQIVHAATERPRLRTGGLWLSLAHAGDVVLCAASDTPVGVDVEAGSGPAADEVLWRRVLSPAERQVVADGGAFLGLWVRKEALLKATGSATSDDLARIDVLADQLRYGGTADRWQLLDLDLGPDRYGSVAFRPGTVVDASWARSAMIRPSSKSFGV